MAWRRKRIKGRRAESPRNPSTTREPSMYVFRAMLTRAFRAIFGAPPSALQARGLMLVPRWRRFGRSFGFYLVPSVPAPLPVQLPKERDPAGRDLPRFLLGEVAAFDHPLYGEPDQLSAGVGIAQRVARRVGGLDGGGRRPSPVAVS